MVRTLSMFLVVAVFAGNIHGQEQDKKYEIRDIKGTKVRVFVGSTDEEKNSTELVQLLFRRDYYKRIGIASLLERMTLDDLGFDGVLDYQKDDAIRIAKSYRMAMESDQTLESRARMLVEHSKMLEKVFLPKQMEVLKKGIKSRSLFRRLNSKKGSDFLELSEKQQSDLKARCEAANARILVLIDELKKESDIIRKELHEVYDKTLTDKQKIQFMRSEDVKMILKSMNIVELLEDTKKVKKQ